MRVEDTPNYRALDEFSRQTARMKSVWRLLGAIAAVAGFYAIMNSITR